jgi:hypothetical protein
MGEGVIFWNTNKMTMTFKNYVIVRCEVHETNLAEEEYEYCA